MNIEKIRDEINAFVKERDWDQFHSPKNLSMALAGETAEILEIFQWLSEEESFRTINDVKRLAAVKEEIADVFIYLLRLADKLKIDIEEAAIEKIELNRKKYPVELSKGKANKYNNR